MVELSRWSRCRQDFAFTSSKSSVQVCRWKPLIKAKMFCHIFFENRRVHLPNLSLIAQAQ
ncbi:hypothetical protein PILCRDRAFT_827447 [Piloderma croceum F 1598]|uniref:Uncharacterized protein n=1 Tax=Piloderma croceum (strain F 1598) TaxID=765440 RepID=A0A0C3F5C5_PILCF|nr:hypothetical protein PILCRDRAFT_827447 [Piloderma croceum F 1598]